MSYRLQRRQLIAADLPTVFRFFKDPRNLEAITPPWLGFRLVEGVEMEDVVEYALPFGPLGRLAHAVAVRRDLDAIFVYRGKRIDGIFQPKEVTV